jgi:hypothetical protein
MTQQAGDQSLAKKIFSSRGLRWSAALACGLLLALFSAAFFFDEPVRALLEKKLNRDLKGYNVRLRGLHIQPIGLSLHLKGLSVWQQAHPEQPVLQLPSLKASIQWRAVLSGRLVAKFMLDRPQININLRQLVSEAGSKASLKERGWQQAAEDIYPLKIDSVEVRDAKITYVDRETARPLVLSHLNLQASNIRNIHLPDQVYPSKFHLDTAIFATGRGSIDGAANFLCVPYPGLKGALRLENVPVDYFNPIFARSNLAIQGGVLQADGEAEYGPNVKTAHLKKLAIRGMKIDYRHAPMRAGADKKRVVRLEKKVHKISKQQGLSLRADELSLTECNIGLVNETPGKKYRLFLSDTDFHLKNYSNEFSLGPAQAQLKAKFMGSGVTTASADFRSQQGRPDLDLHVRIDNSQLTALNDVLRAYGNFDVVAGSFSLVSEMHVKNGMLTGYVKPFFKDMKVYDRKQDKGRGVLHQVYEMMVGGVAGLLENRTRQEVATKATIKGSVGKPETSSWQIVGQLVKNAFFKAILPSFDILSTGPAKR